MMMTNQSIRLYCVLLENGMITGNEKFFIFFSTTAKEINKTDSNRGTGRTHTEKQKNSTERITVFF